MSSQTDYIDYRKSIAMYMRLDVVANCLRLRLPVVDMAYETVRCFAPHFEDSATPLDLATTARAHAPLTPDMFLCPSWWDGERIKAVCREDWFH